MATETQQKPIHSLILDTGPLIKNAVSVSTIINSAEEIFTTPAIISEIRDEATRSRVQTTLMPFLKIRNPSPASYDAVIAFSKKTGDHSVLSRQDLGILALAYEVHCERNGGPWGLREAPKQPVKKKPGESEKSQSKTIEKEEELKVEESGPSVEPEKPEELDGPKPEQAGEEATLQGPGVELAKEEAQPTQQVTESVEEEPAPQEFEGKVPEPEQTQQLEQPAEIPEITTSAEANQEQPTPSTTDIAQNLSTLDISKSSLPSPPDTDESDSDGEWITPSNLSSKQAKDSGLQSNSKTSRPQQLDVATMTIDFAMQNVLLQMNLHLLSTNMQRIKNLSSKVLRCHACFAIVKQLDKQFCPRCGGASLQRVSCSTSANGEFKIHLARNYQWNKRGDKYSVPKPVAGTANGKWSGVGGGKGGWGRDLILAEDQKEYTRQIEQGKREAKARDLMDDDYLPGILTGDRGRSGGRVKVGAGKNVNSRKRF